MPTNSLDNSPARLLPPEIFGTVMSTTPIRMGLSGAGVFAVTTDRGDFILRRVDQSISDDAWPQQLLALRRASAAQIAPPIVHVDDTQRAVVSARVAGGPLAVALAVPAQRPVAIASVVAQMRATHALEPAGIPNADPIGYARRMWAEQSARDLFPRWVGKAPVVIARAAELLESDPRRVVGHNDLNPGNIMWDGARAWIVDWDTAGLAHPYYDAATFTLFLNMDATTSNQLLAAQEQRPLSDDDASALARLQRLVALVVGTTFLSLVPELAVFTTVFIDDAPSLGDCYAAMRAGLLDLQTPRGRAEFGLAFLRLAATPV